MVTAIEFRNVTKELGKKVILDNISFQIKKGEIFGIIGMSGSGKTTLLQNLIGFFQPNEGEIFYYQNPLNPEPKKIHKNLHSIQKVFGFAPQTPSFYPRLTIEENLFHFGSLYNIKKKNIKPQMDHLLELTKLSSHRKKLAEHLSGGMQRRFSIICALVHNPEVLILDEPTADLDPILREETWKLIHEINKLGTTVVIASHFLQELEDNCHRVAILHEGKVSCVGSLDEIKKNYHQNQIEVHIKVDKPEEYLKKLSKRNFSNYNIDDDSLVIHTTKPAEVLSEISRSLKSSTIKSIQVHEPSLKEIFELLEKNQIK